jgi:threonine dehydrogenase-like Zn-dependent dehydrogenase
MAAFPSHFRAIPQGLAASDAAWVEPAATALRGVERAGDLRGRTVLVTGGGPIGQLACRLAHLKSPHRVLLMEPATERAQMATASHATVITGEEAESVPASVDVVIKPWTTCGCVPATLCSSPAPPGPLAASPWSVAV